MYVCTHVCMYVGMYVCMYVCMLCYVCMYVMCGEIGILTSPVVTLMHGRKSRRAFMQGNATWHAPCNNWVWDSPTAGPGVVVYFNVYIYNMCCEIIDHNHIAHDSRIYSNHCAVVSLLEC